jgi:hypothetical protein
MDLYGDSLRRVGLQYVSDVSEELIAFIALKIYYNFISCSMRTWKKHSTFWRNFLSLYLSLPRIEKQ